MNRIEYLDGLRGLAILLVVGFHSFSRWTDIVPYGNMYSNISIFEYGYLGVHLFFLISGFVILMTLERCQNGIQFIYRRWLRLFPAMFLCSLIIYISSPIFFERPNGQPGPLDVVPGIIFIDPYILQKLTSIAFNDLEGAFWSLYVEFKFYVVSALIFFKVRPVTYCAILFSMALAWYGLSELHLVLDNSVTYYASALTSLLSFEYFGWFSAGAAFYLYTKTRKVSWYIAGTAMAVVSAFIESQINLENLIAALLIVTVFCVAISFSFIQSILSNKILLFLGFISYPLYLMHENMMISIIVKLDAIFPFLPYQLLPLISLLLVSALAYLIAKYAEKPFKNLLKSSLEFTKTLIMKTKYSS